ncbi:DUF3404 domain-containing protein [Veronia pacifica]|uniref:histidine kinase n=1 Tax=Veronia pacifica TaxID=1080227 RepID=A0A1C3EDA7_9GAMM|nr:DUF3404 domain-containing protein [Veronia pacifica]ODA31215.1 histidine kinase [Veronia pacifica]
MNFGRVIALCVFLSPQIATGQTLQEKWQSLFHQSWDGQPFAVTQQSLDMYPVLLLESSVRYVDLDKFTWSDIEGLYTLSKTCQPDKKYSEHLKDAIEFELALCKGRSLDIDWFTSHNLLHPAGGSFADRYLARSPDTLIKKQLARYLTVGNTDHPLHDRLSILSDVGRDSLLQGYRAWLEGNILWLTGEQGWKAVPPEHWRPIAQNLNITITGKNCAFRYSNLCVNQAVFNTQHYMLLVIALVTSFVAFGIKYLYVRRRQSQERRFVLQLLTHELRTPMTSLGLTVEVFRKQFDELSVDAQGAVWRLISDYQRLLQLTDQSKAYLNANDDEPLKRQTGSLDEWLCHVCEKHNIDYQLENDIEIYVPFYWLTVCLENLINNAKIHGSGKIEVIVSATGSLIIEVRDDGRYPSMFRTFINRFQQRDRSQNMGVGLTIVSHLMKLMGGKLRIRRDPTRCILELPL